MTNYTEAERLEAVKQFLDLDYDKNSEFQNVVDLAGELCEKPVALITLLDEKTNWIKAGFGYEPMPMPRETSFCKYAIQNDGVTIIPDALEDSRFNDNPLVHEAPNVRFYAGAPLVLKNGIRVGNLCLFDLKPNKISDKQQKTLSILSKQVTFLMELELSNMVLKEHIKEIEAQNERFLKIAHIQSHEVRQPLSSIMGIVDMIKEDGYKADESVLKMMEEAATQLDNTIHNTVELIFSDKAKNV